MRRLIPALGSVLLAACADSGGATSPPRPVADITLTAPSNVLVAGTAESLTARLTAANGTVLAGRTVSWAVSDTAVVAISAAGAVSALQPGSAVVTASSGGRQAQLTLQVAPAAIPLLRVPFAGTFPISNPFDHDTPHEFADSNGFDVDWLGARLFGRVDGHNGYDWPMPPGTPVLAAADGRVDFAGSEQPWSCPLLDGATVSALYVHILHHAPTGELFATVYVHLSRIDVQKGDSVRAGQPVGLSGTTGCSTGPHLHLTVVRQLYSRSGSSSGTVVDPFGWAGNYPDPWLLEPDGAASTRLWLPGEAPPYQLTARFDAMPLDVGRAQPTLAWP